MKTSLIAIAFILVGTSAHAACNEQVALQKSVDWLEAKYGKIQQLKILTVAEGQGELRQFTNLMSFDAQTNGSYFVSLMGKEVFNFECQSISHIVSPPNLIQ